LESVIDSVVAIEKDREMVVVACIEDILIATKGSPEKHYAQVCNVLQLLMANHMSVEMNKCIFDAKKVPFLEIIVSGLRLRMDPDKAKAIVQWPCPTDKKVFQQLVGLWYFYHRFV
jgi:hypothetical protein